MHCPVIAICRFTLGPSMNRTRSYAAPRQMHAQLLHQLAFTADAIQVADQQDAKQKLGINRRAARLAVPVLQLFAHEGKADVLFDESQQVGLRKLIFQAEVVEQRFRAVVLPHHDQQASDDRNQTEHGRMLSSNMLLLNLILLIDVTFSTPTPDFVNYQRFPRERSERTNI